MKRPLSDIRSWGPSIWKSLHTIAVAYEPTKKNKERYKRFFTSIQHVLPCPQCRAHYRQHLLKYPLSPDVLASKQALFHWTVDIHNAVNAQNNKPLYTYDQAWAEQSQWHGRQYWKYCVFGAIILFFIFKCRQR